MSRVVVRFASDVPRPLVCVPGRSLTLWDMPVRYSPYLLRCLGSHRRGNWTAWAKKMKRVLSRYESEKEIQQVAQRFLRCRRCVLDDASLQAAVRPPKCGPSVAIVRAVFGYSLVLAECGGAADSRSLIEVDRRGGWVSCAYSATCILATRSVPLVSLLTAH